MKERPNLNKVIGEIQTMIDENQRSLVRYIHVGTLMDILHLLKEQEPVEAVADGEDSYMCSNCGTVIGWTELDPGGIEEVKYRFCPECGKMVQWND